MNNFIEVNEKMVARSYCCVIASGRTLNAGGSNDRRYFIGLANASIDAICPTTSELRKMFPNAQNLQDPVYVGTTDIDGKAVPNVRIDVFTSNVVDGVYCRFSIFLTKTYVKGSTSGKIQVIDLYGRTAWVTPEELAAHKVPVYSNGLADLSPDYRPLFRGEAELTKLIKCMLGIDDVRQWDQSQGKFVNTTDSTKLENCKCRFELSELEAFFKGKFDVLKEYVTYPTKNDVKFMYGVRTASNGNIYQDICAAEFMKSNARGSYDYDQLLKGRTFNNVEYSTEPLHEYAVNPTSVVAETTAQPETAETPFDPTSDMPFQYL